ncbi:MULTISPECIES: GTP 3',8-cyclase MoaA [Pseudomonas]|uniref:radical SAM protein n=1 Tax=Pseudomonas TaxID=286 RepID=UPI001473FA1F|nr:MULTISPECIES: GTP 3',8-cyclase MoaA [Pseudomonas]MCU0211241.1 radical SAM protein [Pseudomonas shahriarae]NMY21356.1 radical SAM protein [Pseudomonas sp. WS 5410]
MSGLIASDAVGSQWSIKISLTDRCNFRCYYCIQLPQIEQDSNNQLTVDAVRKILTSAKKNGVKKVLWTGGEPTVGPLLECSKIASELGFLEQGITSNGFLLNGQLDELIANGLTRANISLDTLNHKNFKDITKSNKLDDVLECIKKCSQKLSLTKINMVVMRTNQNEIIDFLKLGADLGAGVIVKFHELWNINPREKWESLYVPHEKILEVISSFYSFSETSLKTTTNPGITYYKLTDSNVKFGVAKVPKSHMCDVKECQKIRVYPNGKTCEGKNLLANVDWDDELSQDIAQVIINREASLIENSTQLSSFIQSQSVKTT